jgi:glucokinase
MGLALLGPGDVLAVGQEVGRTVSRAGGRTYCALGPGTGLGVSALVVRGDAIFALETEGGHVGFAPGTADELAVLQRLMARFGRVSAERLLCGSGLSNLHQAIGEIAEADRPSLQPERIVALAGVGSDSHCVRAVEMFCDALGSVAGDFALSYGAWNGVYIAGGLVGHLMPWLRRESVRRRFNDKGRFASALSVVPLLLVTHPQPGLLGAAAFAVLASGGSLVRGGSFAEMTP